MSNSVKKSPRTSVSDYLMKSANTLNAAGRAHSGLYIMCPHVNQVFTGVHFQSDGFVGMGYIIKTMTHKHDLTWTDPLNHAWYL